MSDPPDSPTPDDVPGDPPIGAFRTGYVAIVGRANVGKSTLLNALVGEKVAITANRPQTTRHRILGIKTTPTAQLLYVDSPGLHRQARKALNRALNRTVANVLADVDVVLLVVEAGRLTADDRMVFDRLRERQYRPIVAVNMVDRYKPRTRLLPVLDTLSQELEGLADAIVPVSAERAENLEALEALVEARLPFGPPVFPSDQLTDRSLRFLAAEFIREPLTRVLRDEVPYALTVEIEAFEEEEALIRIAAIIWVERSGQRAIILGKGGERLKELATRARQTLERLYDKHVYLNLWIKVKEDWSDDALALRRFGFDE